jgi:hypothetical protein
MGPNVHHSVNVLMLFPTWPDYFYCPLPEFYGRLNTSFFDDIRSLVTSSSEQQTIFPVAGDSTGSKKGVIMP